MQIVVTVPLVGYVIPLSILPTFALFTPPSYAVFLLIIHRNYIVSQFSKLKTLFKLNALLLKCFQ